MILSMGIDDANKNEPDNPGDEFLAPIAGAEPMDDEELDDGDDIESQLVPPMPTMGW